MRRKTFTVLIVPHDHRGPMRQVSMSRRFFSGLVTGLVVVFAAAVILPSWLARGAAPVAPPPVAVVMPAPAPQGAAETQRLHAENEALRSRVFSLAREVEQLTASIEEFQDIAGVGIGPDAAAAGGVPDDSVFEFENPEFFRGDPVKLAQQEIEKAGFWNNSLQDRISDWKLRDATTPSIFPVRGGLVMHGYRWRIDPFTRKMAFHRGVDIAARRGTPVFATANGIVTDVGWKGGYGRSIEIRHDAAIATLYGHLDRSLVKKGDVVRKGDIVALVGSSGRSTGPHLHYEVLEYGRAVDPMMYMDEPHDEVSRR